MRHAIAAVTAVLVVFLALGCAGKKKPVPPEKLWADANQAFDDEAWEYAVEQYKKLLDQHPFDARAEEAELRIAQAHYFAGRYAEAIAAFGDFERMHATSPNLPEVEYYLGMSYLAQASTSDRDQQVHANAITYFRNVTDRFPDSPWAERAQLRMKECREELARHEAGIATYYLGQRNLGAAEARLRWLLTQYPDSDAAAEALYTFARAYAARDEAESATLALATLVRHHPDDPLAREAREQLGPESPAPEGDPLPLLLSHLDQMRSQEDRQKLRPSVSAYPEVGGVNSGF